MRIKLMIVGAVLLLSGCSATLTSRDITLDLRATKTVPIGVLQNNIDVTQVSRSGKYGNFKNDLHNTLLSESKGNVQAFTDQPLQMSIAFRFKPEFNNSALIGITSLFLPFLAFVTEDNNEVYAVDYAIRDNRGSVVHQRSLKGNVTGSMDGFYIGRINAAQNLLAIEAEYAAKNAARMVLKDLDENAEALYAAVNAPRLVASLAPPIVAMTTLIPATPPPAVEKRSSESAEAYQEAKKLNTPAAYEYFLRQFPEASERRDALAAMAVLAGKPKGNYEKYRGYVDAFPDGLEFVPQEYRLALIGPEGMRVHDILDLLKEGIDANVIAAKIRMQNGIYKDFDFKEISALKKKGMSAVLIEAMLDSTNRAKRAQEELQKKKEMEALLTDINHAQRRLDELKAAQGAQKAQSQTQVQASVPVQQQQQATSTALADTVKNCAAQIAALEACKRLPGFGQSMCKAVAKSQFPCD